MNAFRSVRGALLQVIHSLLILPPSVLADDYIEKVIEEGAEEVDEKVKERNDDSNVADHWHIYVTGHSLGGALATLFSFELGRIRAGVILIDDREISDYYSIVQFTTYLTYFIKIDRCFVSAFRLVLYFL